MARANNHWFEFAGVSSLARNLKLKELPTRTRPALRAGDGTPVLGRDGLLWLPEDAYEEFEITVRCQIAPYAKRYLRYSQLGDGVSSPANVRELIPGVPNTGAVVVTSDGINYTATAPIDIWSGWIDNNGAGADEYVCLVLTGAESWVMENNKRFSLSLGIVANIIPASNSVMFDGACSHFPPATPDNTWAGVVGASYRNAVNPGISIAPGASIATTTAQFKEWLTAQSVAGTPVKIVYRRATSITFSVTPMTDLIHAWLTGRGWLRFSDATNRAYKARALRSFERVHSEGCTTRQVIEVVFSCAPCEYVYPVPSFALTNGVAVVNPGTRYAAPKITVVGSGTITLTIGTKTLTLTGVSSSIVLDVEAGVVYNGVTGLGETGKVSGDWPLTIPPGSNAVAWTGTVSSVTVDQANWRYL